MSALPDDTDVLLARVREAARLPARVAADGAIELCPQSPREAARAQAVRATLGEDAARVRLDLAGFDRIGEPEPSSGTLRAGASASLGAIEASLQGWALTLGWLSAREKQLKLGEWLEGPRAGMRVSPAGRLEPAVIGLTVALRGGGLWTSPGAPRSALGPLLPPLFLGAGGQAGVIVEARLRALPKPEVVETLPAAFDRPEGFVAFLRKALHRELPIVEAQTRRKGRGWVAHLVLASASFRARRDRSALEDLARESGQLRSVFQVEDLPTSFEGELGWDRLAWAVNQTSPLGIERISLESVVVCAAAPVKGALPLDRVPEPLPERFLAALDRPGAAKEGA